jgi:hypothetical protein
MSIMETKQLSDLVKRLTKEQDIEYVRPEKTAKAIKECIDREYVHLMFKATGTELGVQLFRPECSLDADYENAKGKIHLVGGLTLNYDKVKCVADIDLSICEGKGFLVPVSDEEYKEIMGKSENLD